MRLSSPGSLLPHADRRTFVKTCLMAAAAVGLPASAGVEMALAVTSRRPHVLWLHFQECTGCTESLLRSSRPDLAELIFDLVSLDYHETLAAAAGAQAEASLRRVMEHRAGEYLLVVEGAIPKRDEGIYCRIGGRTAVELLRQAAAGAAAVFALGSCASFGGVAAADPNPTGARGVSHVLTGTKVVAIPGCPPNPYNFLGVVLQFATYGTLPELDAQGRPVFAYGRTIHEHCPRRPHFDAGRFAEQIGDEGARQGFCLYKLGCKGPQTHANCSTLRFGEVGTWPVRAGHPCVGCTEASLAFKLPIHATVEIDRPTPPDTYAPIRPEGGGISPVATGVAGLAAGALLGAGAMAARRLDAWGPPDDSAPRDDSTKPDDSTSPGDSATADAPGRVRKED
ncbi:MAG: hydrogenase small subunit [Vicinamibacterales bacterium]